MDSVIDGAGDRNGRTRWDRFEDEQLLGQAFAGLLVTQGSGRRRMAEVESTAAVLGRTWRRRELLRAARSTKCQGRFHALLVVVDATRWAAPPRTPFR